MGRRYLSIWFLHLKTDWHTLRDPSLQLQPFVLAKPDHGRMIVCSTNLTAEAQGIHTGMILADAKAIVPDVVVKDDDEGLAEKLLRKYALWCIRFTPVASIDLPDGLILDISGCAHLWGGETSYLTAMVMRLSAAGYKIRASIADTPAAAWGMARHSKNSTIVQEGMQSSALLSLPPDALRIEHTVSERLAKLGLYRIADIIQMPRQALRRRFGKNFLLRLDQALGREEEVILPVIPPEPFQERLSSIEPIITATGIGIALQQLIENLCTRLEKEGKGARKLAFRCYRVDGKTETIEIGTSKPSYNIAHLFKLFELKINTIEPDLGIELFVLDAIKVEDAIPIQEKLWETAGGLLNTELAEFLDRLANKIGTGNIQRFLPAEHHWPERSIHPVNSLEVQPSISWNTHRPRPMQLLASPHQIEVTAPIPDYPPMNFRYRNKLHKIVRADGPERIEREWWLEQGSHRDYYQVEDESGCRYWVFRLGHYNDEQKHQWFLHGFFA